MKVLLALHGYPPELMGGTESAVQALAHGLTRRGHEVVVVAGSMDHAAGFRVSEARDAVAGTAACVKVLRIHRDDLYFDHWHKSASARVSAAFGGILRAERPDLVHVHHWIRLTRDLVACAARAGLPALVSLHDHWTTCLITFRVRSDTHRLCEVPLAPDPCLACAGRLPPRTPWVGAEQARLLLHARHLEVSRELDLARAVLVPSRSHGAAVERGLALAPGTLRLRCVPPGREAFLARNTPLEAPARLGRLVLGAWGHLSELKGADIVLEALRRSPEPARIALHLAGAEVDARFGARLRELAHGLDVSFHGPYDGPGVLQNHPAAHVHAMVSGTRAAESWGLVVDEAVQLGLPVVLPRSGAFAERLRDEAWGSFYEPCDPDSLSRALWRLWSEPGLLERQRAHLPDPAEACATLARHLELTLQAYEDVLRAGPPAPPAEEWWQARLRQEEECAWDEALLRAPASELGFAP